MAKSVKRQGGVAAKVEALVQPAIEQLGVQLWDVCFEKEGDTWYLKVLIERDGLMDMDTCEAVSRAIDPLLDEADLIEQSYCLEVGSPGLGRRLARPEHFEKMLGQKIKARFYAPDSEGRKEIEGTLQSFDELQAVLLVGDTPCAVLVKDASVFTACDDQDLF